MRQSWFLCETVRLDMGTLAQNISISNHFNAQVEKAGMGAFKLKQDAVRGVVF